MTLIWHVFAYRNSPIPYCYRFYEDRKRLLKNSTIHQIYLREDIDSCETFTVKSLSF